MQFVQFGPDPDHRGDTNAAGRNVAGAGVACLTGCPFKANTEFLSLNPGDYDVTVTAAGSKTPAIGPLEITITAGGVYTAIARDAAGGGAPLDLILLDDFVN